MLTNIDINKMNRLMEENKDAKTIITQLLENHHTTVSMIAHEIRNPLTLVSSSLQNSSSGGGFHSLSKTVHLHSCSFFRLISPFHDI